MAILSSAAQAGLQKSKEEQPEQGEVAPSNEGLTLEQKERRRLAKRIVKAVQPGLEDATRKEAELGGKPFAKELRDLDLLLESSAQSRRGSMAVSLDDDMKQIHDQVTKQLLISSRQAGDTATAGERSKVEMNETMSHAADKLTAIGSVHGATSNTPSLATPADTQDGSTTARTNESEKTSALDKSADPMILEDSHMNDAPSDKAAQLNGIPPAEAGTQGGNDDTGPSIVRHPAPPTPPMSSEEDLLAPLSQGGIPWYLEPFDPVGTSIQEERWTGREVVRGMSEELSEIDEDELKGLVDVEMDMADDGEGGGVSTGMLGPPVADPTGQSRRGRTKAGRVRRRWRGFR